MTWIKKNLYFAAIPISVALSLISAVSVKANSQTRFVGTQKVRTDLISELFETEDRGTPSRTTGGASRSSAPLNGGCDEPAPRLISVMPKEKITLTFKKYPEFFWYISKSDAQTAEFLLLDENRDIVYRTNFQLPKKQGIFAFTLPPHSPGLKVNQKYRWSLRVDCSIEQPYNTMSVEGWVERTRLDLSMRIKLNKSEPKQRSKIYADAGIWHEAISNAAQQRCNFPQDSNVMLYWNQLLTSVGLSKVVSEPLNNSCIVKN